MNIRNPKSEYRNSKQILNSKYQNSKHPSFEHSNFGNSDLFRISNFVLRIFCFLLLVSCLILCTLYSVLCTLPASASPTAPASTPTRAIQELDDLLDDYKTGPNLTPEDEEFNKQLKKKIIHGTFDIRELCIISLSKHWGTRTQDEQDHFVQLMTDLLENVAVLSKEQSQKKAKTERIYQITYKGDKYLDNEKTRALTKTAVYVKSENVSVELDYKLKKTSSDWNIYDVIVDGASLVDNYRYQFNSIITKHGYPELVARLENKLAEVKKK